MKDAPYFEVLTPLGIKVRTTPAYWARIVTYKHPIMRGKENLVQAALGRPEQVRRSIKDPSVHLYYGADPPYHVCVVVKCIGDTGFLVTSYRTDSVKEGERIWPR